jgi:RsiW-degrading membrane proteinase PrsW (M82 family)
MRNDPVKTYADSERDLYEIATWEPRSLLDRVAVRIWGLAVTAGRFLIVGAALVLTAAIGAFSAISNPTIGMLTILSALPALALAGYVYLSDISSGEPLGTLVATFILSVLFASFAALVNSLLSPVEAFGVVGSVLFFFLVVGPVEETVKLLSVRLYAYRQTSFDSVIDGAVYGAVAGLGFATIENAIYIRRGLDMTGEPAVAVSAVGLLQLAAGSDITVARALAGPGHVVYSAFAGYYLGLAKFNREHWGPIVVKGILIAALIHAVYNSLAGVGAGAIALALDVQPLYGFFGFVLVYQGFFGLVLLRKLRRYRDTYREVYDDADRQEDIRVERTEFDG